MAYADYEFYTTVYKGTMSESDFERLSERATDYIDSKTDYAFASNVEEDMLTRVKKACCAIAEEYCTIESGGGKASESVDGYSVSYIAGIAKSRTAEQRLADAIMMYLSDYVRAVRWV